VSAFSQLTATPCRFYRKPSPPNIDPNKPLSLYDFHGLSEEDKRTELYKILNKDSIAKLEYEDEQEAA
jgi:hypothetical protein